MSLRKPWKKGLFIAVAEVLIPLQVFLAVPVPAQAQQVAVEPAEELPQPSGEALLEALATPPPAAPVVQVNRTPLKVPLKELYPTFSAEPSDDEIFRARVFGEPLVPLGGEASVPENQALANAITSYLRGGNTEDLSAFDRFLQSYPSSRWKASILSNTGAWYRRIAYFSRAETALKEAWDLANKGEDRSSRVTADAALGQLLDLHMQFGHQEQLEALLGEAEGRDVLGGAAEFVEMAKATLWGLKYDHQNAIPSGPVAVGKLLFHMQGIRRQPEEVEKFHATPEGASLGQMKALAKRVGLELEMVFREAGAEIVAPAVIHLKQGHFAALIREEGGRLLLDDPLLGGEVWMSRKALEEEASGYFLIPQAPLKAKWRKANPNEGDNVRGKCVYATGEPGCTGKICVPCGGGGSPPPGGCGGGGCGMAGYTFHTMLAGLSISDTPVGYSPPRGPSVGFEVTYNQKEAYQPLTFYYSNLGAKWSFDWISYLEDNPTSPGTGPIQLYARGGGRETYDNFVSGTSAPNLDTRAAVVLISSSPIKYERQLADGSVEVFAQPDGATTSPRRVFMTESKDPAGNKLTFSYDAQLRLVSVTDAINQVTTLSYELVADPLKITKVNDPFGRFATFEYNASGQLVKITDVIGLTSEFEYGSGDFIRSLITPYGTTGFSWGTGPYNTTTNRWLEAVDPLGGKERVEHLLNNAPLAATDAANTVPTGFSSDNANLNTHLSVFYDKRVMALYPADPTKGKITRWRNSNQYKVSGVQKQSEKLPLENRVWHGHDGEPFTNGVSPSGRPAKIARVLDDGSSQIHRYEHNPKGKVIRNTDPVGRETLFVYGAGSTPDPDPATGAGIDLLQVKQKNGMAYDLLGEATYNTLHLPLTFKDAAGKITTFTYTAQGKLETITTPERAGITENRTTTFSYNANGYLQSVTGPSAGATITRTYDSYGRVRTLTDSDNYTLTYDYDSMDRATKITYPDGSFEETIYERLDPVRRRDRLGRWSHTLYDALRRVTVMKDALGRTAIQRWCSCGSLDELVDPNGNPTRWQRDIQGRVTKEIRASSSVSLRQGCVTQGVGRVSIN